MAANLQAQIVCVNSAFSRGGGRGAAGSCRSVSTWMADLKRSSQCNVNVLFETNAKYVSRPH